MFSKAKICRIRGGEWGVRLQAFMHGFLEDLLRCHNLTSQMSNDLKEISSIFTEGKKWIVWKACKLPTNLQLGTS